MPFRPRLRQYDSHAGGELQSELDIDLLGRSNHSVELVAERGDHWLYFILKLPRFRGHPTFWVEGVHDVEAKATLPT